MCDPCDCGQPTPEIVVKCTIAERQVTFDPDAVGTFRVKAAMLSDAVRTMHVKKAAFGLQVAVVETLSEELSVLNEMLDIQEESDPLSADDVDAIRQVYKNAEDVT